MNYNENNSKFKENMTLALEQFANSINLYSILPLKFQEIYDQLRPMFEKISQFSSIINTAKQLAENQYVVVSLIPLEMINEKDKNDINTLILEYLSTEEQIRNTIKQCSLDDNRVFQQSIKAMDLGFFDLAIIGLTSVLDQLLSEWSCQIKSVRIKSRSEAIIKKIEDKGDLFIDELDGADLLLFTTYPRALELFGKKSDFLSPEPTLLNRHWIMHGRTNKQYSFLDCIKVLNMIYGTIRMGQIGMIDEQDECDE